MNGARQSVPTATERGSSGYRRHRHIARWTLASPTLTLHTTCHMNGARQSVPTAMERGSSGYRRHRHIARWVVNTGLSYTHTAHHMSHERSEAERAHSHGARQQRLQEAQAYSKVSGEHWPLLHSHCTPHVTWTERGRACPQPWSAAAAGYRRHRHIARWVVNTGLSYTHTAHHMSHERSEAERAHSHTHTGARQQRLQEAQAYSKVSGEHWPLLHSHCTPHVTWTERGRACPQPWSAAAAATGGTGI